MPHSEQYRRGFTATPVRLQTKSAFFIAPRRLTAAVRDFTLNTVTALSVSRSSMDIDSNQDGISAGRPLESARPRILIVRAGAIGDTLMVTPLLRALRRTYPRAYLAAMCSAAAHDVFRHNPHLDQLVVLAHRNLPMWMSIEKQRITRQLRALDLDCALVLEGHPRYAALARQSGAARVFAYAAHAATPRRDGFERVEFDRQRHSVENHLRMARPLNVQPDGLQMDLNYPAPLDDAVERRLAAAGISPSDIVVGVHPGWGGRKHPLDQTRLRSWPPQRFAEVIRWLVDRVGARVVLTGTLSDRPLAEFIATLSGVPSVNLAGQLSLLELAALIRRLNLYVTVDSGPAHMAAALGTPLITLWGPGILEQTAPLAGRGPVRVLYHQVPCAPCYGTPLMKSCQDNICMKQIGVTEVEDAIESMLASRHPGPPGKVAVERSGD